MKPRRAAVVVFFSLVACLVARAERLRVVSWNLENYTLTYRRTASGKSARMPKPEKQKDALRAVIRAENPDILAVQEIGGEAFVEELRRDLASEGMNYPHTASLAGPDPERRIAFLSRKPFGKIFPHERMQTNFDIPSPHERVALVNRGLLGVSVSVAGRPVTIHTLHLKSRLTRDKADPRAARERLAESDTVRAALVADGVSQPGALALVCGDFNDGPNSATITRFLTPKAPGLTLPEALDKSGETWTYRNDAKGFLDRSDYAFVSPDLRPFVAVRPSDEARARIASDHRPVIIDIDIPDTP